MPHLYYLPDERDVEAHADETILQASLRSGIPHTHVCGGYARCSTCRVLILEGLAHCAPRNAKEQAMAERLRFGPTIRLACQTTVTGDVKLRRLVLDAEDVEVTSQLGSAGTTPGAVGQEKQVAILFADIRGFTSFAETLPPYDVVHLLNRYFYLMGQVIGRHGGYIDNYMGTLHKRSFEIGVGVHFGEVVVGAVGAPDKKRVTAIGDAVNFASRIESATKTLSTQFLISEDAYTQVSEQVKVGRRVRVALPGKSGDHALYEVTGLKVAGSAESLGGN